MRTRCSYRPRKAAARPRVDDAPLANWLTLEGQVYGGQLWLQWGFSRDMFAEATVQQLADAYTEELTALIEHCCATPAGQVTPSDFPLARHQPGATGCVACRGRRPSKTFIRCRRCSRACCSTPCMSRRPRPTSTSCAWIFRGWTWRRSVAAWQAAINRHDILRSSFHWLGLEAAHQVIHRQIDLQLQVIEAADIDLDALAAEERSRGFELSAAPLLRLMLVRQSSDAWHLIYTSHHILMDGWSNAQLLGEVIQHYAGADTGQAAGAIPRLPGLDSTAATGGAAKRSGSRRWPHSRRRPCWRKPCRRRSKGAAWASIT